MVSRISFRKKAPIAAMRVAYKSEPNLDLKKAIWLYFFLLLFEGGLRKWGIPALATPLLIIRDPIALWLIVKANQRKLITGNLYVIVMSVITIGGFFLAIIIGHGDIAVAVFGARIGLLHFPLMFIIGKVFTRDDVIKMGRCALIIAVPMTLLLAAQFYSPQTAWVNRGLGGDEAGSGFSGANGYFRPSGTFSFTSGNSLFYGVVSTFVVFFWLNSKYIKKSLLWAGTAALLMAVPLSISRSLFSEVSLSVFFAFIFALRKPQYLGRIVITLIIGAGVILILSKFDFFATATDALTTRFDQASAGENKSAASAFLDRFLGGTISAIEHADQLPFWGLGLGMGTNVGAKLLTGSTTYLIAEGEWARVIGEQGILLGFAIILCRLLLVAELFVKSFKALVKDNILPWMLMSFGILMLLQAQMGQPTSLGFSTLIGGLIMAALNKTPNKNKKIENRLNR